MDVGFILATIAVLFLGFVGMFELSNLEQRNLAKSCESTVYKNKPIVVDAIYQIPNDPNSEKFKIKINKIENVKNNAHTAATLGFIFYGCELHQQIKFSIFFEDKLVTNFTKFSKYNEDVGFNFGRNLSFYKSAGILDKSEFYNFEDKLLDSFHIQTINNLTLYTTKSTDEGFNKRGIKDEEDIFLVENNGQKSEISLIEIPTKLFNKTYSNFQKNGDKLEITFISYELRETFCFEKEITETGSNFHSVFVLCK